MKNKLIWIDMAFLVGIFILGGIIGYFINNYLDYKDYDKKFEGLRFVSNNDHPNAILKAQEYDKKGNWICVNVRNMGFEKALEICNHEIGHEIFALVCEKNITKCMDAVK